MSYKIKNIIASIEKDLLQFIDRKFEVTLEKIDWETPPESEMGDLAFSCFALSREIKRNPIEISEVIAQEFESSEYVDLIKNVGPYVNFYFKKGIFSFNLISEILDKPKDFGRGEKKDERVMLEGFGQANTHKAFHIGHLRNVFISESMSNLLEFGGYSTIRANYHGDIGTHVATWLWYFINYVEDKDEILKIKPKKVDSQLSKKFSQIYTQAKVKAEEVEGAGDEISQILQKLEAGDKELTKLWEKTKELSLADFRRIYELLKIKFKEDFFESDLEKPGKKIVEDLIKQNIAVESEGAMIVNLEEYGLGVLLVLKSDGTSLYSTKDLALAELKFKKYKIDKSIYVIDSRQGLYLKQIFKTLELMGFTQADKCHHLAYGFVKLKEGVMSSRKGNVILAEDLYQQILEKVKAEIAKRENVEQKEVDEIAHKITLSALKFGMLKYTPESNITFDLDSALRFEGDTGPYLQYTYARINNIKTKNFSKRKLNLEAIDFSLLRTKEEWELIKKLAEFSKVIEKSIENYNPTTLASYLLNLASDFNKFYALCPVAQAENENLQAGRLALISSVAIVLKSGLEILGIEVVEKM